jgi:hypothetical protein
MRNTAPVTSKPMTAAVTRIINSLVPIRIIASIQCVATKDKPQRLLDVTTITRMRLSQWHKIQNRSISRENSLFLEKFSLIRVRKFPVPLRREFGCKPLSWLDVSLSADLDGSGPGNNHP